MNLAFGRRPSRTEPEITRWRPSRSSPRVSAASDAPTRARRYRGRQRAGPRQRDHALDVELPGRKQPAYRRHVLIADVPRGPAPDPRDRARSMCRPAVPAGCGPANSSTTTRSAAGTARRDPAATHTYVVPAHSLDNAMMPVWKSAARGASTESTSGAWGRVSIAVTNKRMRRPVRGRYLGIRARSQRGPCPGLDEQCANGVRIERRGVRTAEARERHLPGGSHPSGSTAIDDRLQRTPFAAMHRSDDAGCRRRMAHPGPLVLDQRRSAQHAVADVHAQCRLDVHVVRGDPGDERRRAATSSSPVRCSGKRNVESPGNAMHGHGVRSFLRRCGTKPGGMPGGLDSQASLAARSDTLIDRGQTPRTQAPGKLYSGRPRAARGNLIVLRLRAVNTRLRRGRKIGNL